MPNRRLKILAAYIIYAITIFLLWHNLIPNNTKNHLASPKTRVKIKKTALIIKKFHEKYSELPNSLGELRLYTISENIPWNPYDGYASRLSYTKLSGRNFYIKSVANKKISRKRGHQYHNIKKHKISWAPNIRSLVPYINRSVMTLGARAPGGSRVAEIIASLNSSQRSLVIHSKKNKFFLRVAPHFHIEEFIWINKRKIVYTATNDPIYNDGIYSWDLKTNIISNILTNSFEKLQFNKAIKNNKYYLSILGVINQEVVAIVKENDGQAISPQDFYQEKFVRQIAINKSQKRKKITQLKFVKTISPQPSSLSSFDEKSPHQKWTTLPLEGTPRTILESWQNFSLKNPNNPLYPYSLFWLACLYRESSEAFSKLSNSPQNTVSARTLEAFGMDINESLLATKSAPTYLKSFALDQRNRFIKKEALGFKISKMGVDSKKNALDTQE